MFRPNIRGIPRQDLRPGLNGWHLKGQPQKVIPYSWPWRTNWVHQIHRNPKLDVFLSRSGKVHILVDVDGDGNKKPRGKFFYAVMAGVTALGALMLATSSIAETKSIAPVELAGSPVAVTNCDQLMLNPDKFLAKENSSSQDQLQLKVISEQQLGGVKSKDVSVSCGAQTSDYRVTYIKQKDVWNIKKWVRLEK